MVAMVLVLVLLVLHEVLVIIHRLEMAEKSWNLLFHIGALKIVTDISLPHDQDYIVYLSTPISLSQSYCLC